MISGCPIAFACFQRRVIHQRATVHVLSFDQVNLFEYFYRTILSLKLVSQIKNKTEKISASDDCTILISLQLQLPQSATHTCCQASATLSPWPHGAGLQRLESSVSYLLVSSTFFTGGSVLQLVFPIPPPALPSPSKPR